jgi:dihydrofolate reductase
VISRTIKSIPGARVFKSIEETMIWLANQELIFPKAELRAFVIGGGEIYKKFLEEKRIDNIYQTIIKEYVSGDVSFYFNPNGWENFSKLVGKKEDFLIWRKKRTEN